MGGGGHMLHAIKSLQANRALRKKRNRASKEDFVGVVQTTELQFIEPTPQAMRKVKKLIKTNAKKERINTLAAVLTTILILCILYWIIF